MFIHEVLAIIAVFCFITIILTAVAKCSPTDSIFHVCTYIPVTYLTVNSLLNKALISGICSYSVRLQRKNLIHHQFKVSCGKN